MSGRTRDPVHGHILLEEGTKTYVFANVGRLRATSSDSREACTSGGGRAVAATPPRYREMPRI
ncbi:hypothetical protein M885DRAFT_558193 [Pelagophyceae sp. CCMP2097]|nr:hypothetical protein M885DRAFT_558193 [Pelagophyceae sp. CCMP2097]